MARHSSNASAHHEPSFVEKREISPRHLDGHVPAGVLVTSFISCDLQGLTQSPCPLSTSFSLFPLHGLPIHGELC